MKELGTFKKPNTPPGIFSIDLNNAKYQSIIDNFIRYGKNCHDFKTSIIIGSRARDEEPADEWSDLDIVLFAEHHVKYIEETAWLKNIGDFNITFVEDTPIANSKERRVLFTGGLDVDFAIISADCLDELIRSPEVTGVLKNGYKILFDKVKAFRGFDIMEDDKKQETEKVLPTPKTINNLVNDFWYHSVWSAKKLLRGELWTAKTCTDGYLKNLLLKMIERQSALMSDNKTVWHDGRFFEKWAEKSVVNQMSNCFAHYEREDIKRALINTMNLFSRVASDVCLNLEYPYPDEAEEEAKQWIKHHLFEQSDENERFNK